MTWRGAAKRVIEAFAQGMLAALAIGALTFDKGGLPWLDAAYIGVGCAILSVLVMLAGDAFGARLRNAVKRRRISEVPLPEPEGELPYKGDERAP